MAIRRLKRKISLQYSAWVWALLIIGLALFAVGCQQKSLPGNKATVQSTPIVINSPKSGTLVDSPLIVQGTASTSEGTVILNLIDKNDHPIMLEEGKAVEGAAENGTFQAVLNFVPPVVANGYLEYFQRNAQGLETGKMRLPIKFTTRLTDPGAYPTAYAISNISMVEQPGGKEIKRPIDKGSVVTVIKTESGWSQILVYTYDAPVNLTGWVPINVLTANLDNLDLIEGCLQADAALFNAPPPNGGTKGYNVTAGQPVKILEKKNGWTHCVLPGGDEGWIQNKNIQFIGPQI